MNRTQKRTQTTITTALMIVVILAAGGAQAQIESAQTGNWNVGSTWVGGAVPKSGEVIINDGHTVTLTGHNQIPAAVDMTVNGMLSLANRNTALSTLRGSGEVRQGSTGAITLTLGSDASSTFEGTITRTAGTLHLTKIGSGTNTLTGINSYNGTTTLNAGELILSSANNFSGAVTVNGGTLSLTDTGTPGSGDITVAGGTTLDISDRNETLALGEDQGFTVRGVGATNVTSASAGLTLGTSTPLYFDAFDGATPTLTVSGGGSLTLQSGNDVTVTVAGQTPLATGNYTLISGGVAGDLPTGYVTVNGAGRAAGTTAVLAIDDDDLLLQIADYSPTHDPADIVTAQDGEWFDSATWDGGIIPGPGDRVTISNDVALRSGTHALASATVINGATLTFETWNASLKATHVTNNGTMTHPPQNAVEPNPVSGEWIPDNRVWIVCSNLTVGASGVIHGDERGYAGVLAANGRGPGASTINTYGTGGASYGGQGSFSSWGAPTGETYGSITHPEDPGSSSAGRTVSSSPTIGLNGGGAIRIDADGDVTLDGRISADGKGYVGYTGGGAGGGILIFCRTIQGSGILCADGGRGRSGSGEGGGGRIAVHYDTDAQVQIPVPDLTLSATAGRAETWRDSTFGTIFLTDNRLVTDAVTNLRGWFHIPNFTSWSPASLTLTNAWMGFTTEGFELSVEGNVGGTGDRMLGFLSNATVTVGGNLDVNLYFDDGGACTVAGDVTFPVPTWLNYQSQTLVENMSVSGDLTLNAGWRLTSAPTNGIVDYGSLIDVNGELTVSDNATLFLHSNPTNGGSALLRADPFTLAAGGTINADGRGFSGGFGAGLGPGDGFGPGGSPYAIGSRTGGGGHGGRGGWASSGTTPGGIANGLPYAPLNAGSGSGGRSSTPVENGVSGGALVRIETGGHATLDGTITANGANSSYTGAGAGGGIFIRARTVSGASGAILSANGGTTNQGGGSGGGGRIAVWYGEIDEDAASLIISGQHDQLGARLSVSTELAAYQGTTTVDRGTGGHTEEEKSSQDGTVFFVTVIPPQGTLILIQ